MKKEFKRKRKRILPLTEKREQDELKKVVPVTERWTVTSAPEEVRVLEFEDKGIKKAMARVTELANKSKPENVEDRFLYQKNLVGVYEKLGGILSKEMLKDGALNASLPIFSVFPRRGGRLPEGVIKEQLKETGIFLHPFKIQLGRTMENGMLGVNETIFESSPPNLKELNMSNTLFGDDCLASTITYDSTVLLFKEFCHEQDIPLKKFKMWIVTSAATQRGIERVLRVTKDEFREIKIIVGILVFRMNDKFYLVDEKDPSIDIVGDMGERQKLLPPEYNKKAGWNEYKE